MKTMLHRVANIANPRTDDVNRRSQQTCAHESLPRVHRPVAPYEDDDGEADNDNFIMMILMIMIMMMTTMMMMMMMLMMARQMMMMTIDMMVV